MDNRKGLVALFIIIAIVIVAALLFWGFVSLGGDDVSDGDGGLTVIDDGVDAETGALLQESFVDDSDDLGLGEVI